MLGSPPTGSQYSFVPGRGDICLSNLTVTVGIGVACIGKISFTQMQMVHGDNWRRHDADNNVAEVTRPVPCF